MTLDATFRFSFDMTQTLASFGDDTDTTSNLNYVKTVSLTDGTGANQANALVLKRLTIAASTNQDEDLTAQKNIWGTTLIPTSVVAVLIINEDPGLTNSTISIGGAASNAWADWCGGTDTVIGPIGPDGFFFMVAPDASGLGTPTNSSDDILRIATGSGAGSTVDVCYVVRI